MVVCTNYGGILVSLGTKKSHLTVTPDAVSLFCHQYECQGIKEYEEYLHIYSSAQL